MSPAAIDRTIIDSAPQLEKIIDLHLSSQCEEDDLKIAVPRRVFLNSNVPKILEQYQLVYTYDPDREAIHLKMPSRVHESINKYLGNRFLDECVDNGLINKDQKTALHNLRTIYCSM